MKFKKFIRSRLGLLTIVLIISLFANFQLAVSYYHLLKYDELNQEIGTLNACVNVYYAKKDQQFLFDCAKGLENIKDLSIDKEKGSSYLFLNYSYYSPYDFSKNPFEKNSGFIGKSEWHESFIPLYGLTNTTE